MASLAGPLVYYRPQGLHTHSWEGHLSIGSLAVCRIGTRGDQGYNTPTQTGEDRGTMVVKRDGML